MAVTPKVTLKLMPSSIAESGSSNSSTVTATLNKAVTGATTVTVSAAAGTAGASEFTLSTDKTLTIAANETSSTGVVTITAVDDSVDEDDETVTVSGAVTTGTPTAPDNVTLTITDDDAKGVTVDPTSLTVAEGGMATYTVKLDSQPLADVTVTPSSSDTTSVTVSGPLTFSSSDWSATQTVTVIAVPDTDADSESVTISNAVAGAGSDYVGVTADAVSVAVTDATTWAATLTVGEIDGFLGCDNFDEEHSACSDVLTDDDFVYGGVTYTVDYIYWNPDEGEFQLALKASTTDEYNHQKIKAALSRLTLSADDKKYGIGVATAYDSGGFNYLHWSGNPGWTKGQMVALSLELDNTAPTVETVEITSSAGSDNAYALGDVITATVTFSEGVNITGKPELELQVGANARKAVYNSGSGSSDLTFDYTVAAKEVDSDGVAIGANKLTLPTSPAATIQDGATNAADLDHGAVAASSSHRVLGSAVWPATLTVDYNDPYYGCDDTFADQDNCSGPQGVLTDNDFDFG